MSPAVPLRAIPKSALDLLDSFDAEPSDLYRALANNPGMLELWIGMAWGLRRRAITDRALREIMILRSAHRHEASYQWADHIVMARQAGVSEEKIEAVVAWESSKVFDQRERAVLALMDDMMSGAVESGTLDSLGAEFDDAEQVELTLTAGFYCMVPRVLNALRLEG